MTRRRIIRHNEEVEPWLRADVQTNRVTSADWGENHPGFCYEFGDANSEPFIPPEVLKAAFMQEQFIVAMWQRHQITKVHVSHSPARTFGARVPESPRQNEWCVITRYDIKSRNPTLAEVDESTDPHDTLPQLARVLRVPLGYSLEGEDQSLLEDDELVLRVLIEFPYEVEAECLPFDTSLAALGALAHKEYQSTIYGSDTV